MAEIFYPVQGCVVTVGNTNNSLYSVSPGPAEGASGDGGVLLTSVALRDQDAVLPIGTLSNRKVIYTFGEDIGDVTVSYLIMLGTASSSASHLVTRFTRWFNSQRVAHSGRLISVSVRGQAYKVALSVLRVMEGDGRYNIQPIAFGGSIVEPP